MPLLCPTILARYCEGLGRLGRASVEFLVKNINICISNILQSPRAGNFVLKNKKKSIFK